MLGAKDDCNWEFWQSNQIQTCRIQYKHNLTTEKDDQGKVETRGRGIMIINSELRNPYANLYQEEKLVKTGELWVENQMLDITEKILKEKKTTYEQQKVEYEESWAKKSPEIKQFEVEKYCTTF